MEVKISVIIPLYNKEKYIARTIRNVLEQTFSDFELLIIDDGSVDASLSIAGQIQDSRIRIIEKANGGVSSARNVGILKARGGIVAFLDADDKWDSDYLFTLNDMVARYPDMVMYAQAYDKIWDNGERVFMRNPFGDNVSEVVIPNYNEYIVTTPLIWTSAVAVNKNYAMRCGLFDEGLTLGEDTDMWFRLALCGPVLYSTQIKAHYMMSASDTIGISLQGKLRCHIAYKAAMQYKNQFVGNKKILRVINTFILHGYVLYLKYGDKMDAKFYEKNLSVCALPCKEIFKYFLYRVFVCIKRDN